MNEIPIPTDWRQFIQQNQLESVLADYSPLPHEAIFLGVSMEDGLPVLLNRLDPLPGPILLVGDVACGKTNFLQTIASAVEQMHAPTDVQYAVITQRPDQWFWTLSSESALGFYTPYSTEAIDLVHSLAGNSRKRSENYTSTLLLIDDVEFMLTADENPMMQDLRYLLLRGPSRNVWPIVTAQTRAFDLLGDMKSAFRTRLYGHMDTYQEGIPMEVKSLIKGHEFLMFEGDKPASFGIPLLPQDITG